MQNSTFDLYKLRDKDGAEQILLHVVPSEGVSFEEADAARAYLEAAGVPAYGAVFGSDCCSVGDLAVAVMSKPAMAMKLGICSPPNFLRRIGLEVPNPD